MDGARYSSANFIRYRHNDVSDLRSILSKIPESSRKLVVTDSIFSMTGEPANLPEIIVACKRYRAILMVDECHSMYVLGKKGGGITEYYGIDPQEIDIVMATLSKAIPASGGYIASNAKVIDFLRHESRGFIYSIALSSVMVSVALKALDLFENNRVRLVETLHHNTSVFQDALHSFEIPIGKSETSIIPIIIGDSEKAAMAAKKCQSNGLYIHAVFPPVVPAGKAILRASITASHTKADLLMAAEKIYNVLKKC
jgi:7-keto-8-aminopelargonate synthetase-like enzyme